MNVSVVAHLNLLVVGSCIRRDFHLYLFIVLYASCTQLGKRGLFFCYRLLVILWLLFWERAAHSVDHIFSLYFDYL